MKNTTSQTIRLSLLFALLLVTSKSFSTTPPATDYSRFIFTDQNVNITCINTNGDASMFAVSVTTDTLGRITNSPTGENKRYDMGQSSFGAVPPDGTPVTLSGRFGDDMYDRSSTNTYVQYLRNGRRIVPVTITNIESYLTLPFSVQITDGTATDATVKGYVTRSFYSYGTAFFDRRGALVRGASTDGPYYTYDGGIAYDGKIGALDN